MIVMVDGGRWTLYSDVGNVTGKIFMVCLGGSSPGALLHDAELDASNDKNVWKLARTGNKSTAAWQFWLSSTLKHGSRPAVYDGT